MSADSKRVQWRIFAVIAVCLNLWFGLFGGIITGYDPFLIGVGVAMTVMLAIGLAGLQWAVGKR